MCAQLVLSTVLTAACVYLSSAFACFCLQELPETLCGLQLVLLDLTNNSLRRLPAALGHMTSLRSMPLDGNALKLMRRELWSGQQ
jgi:Leucine-rich repeat (LRR) protein